MTVDGALLGSAWVMGFLGSTHCAGMCSGISAALSFALPAEARTGPRLAAYQVTYNIGRIATYGLLGAILGGVGQALFMRWDMTLWPRLLAAALMLVAGLYLAGWWKGLLRLERLGGGLWKYLQPLSRRLLPVDNLFKALVAGSVWGFLPCGLVYSGLGLALTAADAGNAALTIVAFGLGTLPTLLVTGGMASRLRSLLQAPETRRLAGVVVMAFGAWTAGMAIYHHGHHHMAGPATAGGTVQPAPAPAAMPDRPAPATPAASGKTADDMAGMDMSDMSDADMARMNTDAARPAGSGH